MLAQQLAEALAGDVFQQADKAGEAVTMDMVRRRFTELRAHPAGCRCGQYCTAVAVVVKAENVYRIAATCNGSATPPGHVPCASPIPNKFLLVGVRLHLCHRAFEATSQVTALTVPAVRLRRIYTSGLQSILC